MRHEPSENQKFVERLSNVLNWIAETLLLIAFFFLCFKFFWFLVRGFTLTGLDYVLEWPMLSRMLVGLPLMALPRSRGRLLIIW